MRIFNKLLPYLLIIVLGLSSAYAQDDLVVTSAANPVIFKDVGVFRFGGHFYLKGKLIALWGKYESNSTEPFDADVFINRKKIYFKFLPEIDELNKIPEIKDAYQYDKKIIAVNGNTSMEKNLEIVNQLFKNIPPHFFEFKEGILEQAVLITLNDMQAMVEGDKRYYYADIVNIEALKKVKETLDATVEIKNDYYLNDRYYIEKDQVINLRSQPNNRSAIVKKLRKDDHLIKIKTVGNWYYVELYQHENATSPALKGYVYKTLLSPVT